MEAGPAHHNEAVRSIGSCQSVEGKLQLFLQHENRNGNEIVALSLAVPDALQLRSFFVTSSFEDVHGVVPGILARLCPLQACLLPSACAHLQVMQYIPMPATNSLASSPVSALWPPLFSRLGSAFASRSSLL